MASLDYLVNFSLMIVLGDCGWTLAAKRQHDKDADGDR